MPEYWMMLSASPRRDTFSQLRTGSARYHLFYVSPPALTLFAALTRAARPAPTQRALEADRPAPAGWAALRLLADVDISFSRNCCWQFRGRTMELGGRWSSGDRRRC